MFSDDTMERRSATGGFTLLEVTITMAIVSIMAIVINATLAATLRADQYLEALRLAKARAETVSFTVHGAARASRKIYGRDEMGEGYLDALDLGRLPMAPSARLPLFDEVNPLGPDRPGDDATGNVILCVRETDPVICAARPDEGVRRYIDLYHIICCYPHQSDVDMIMEDDQDARDLVVWYSEGYPSYNQVMSIQDVGDRQRVVQQLYEQYECRQLWDVNAEVDAAFYAIDAGGAIAPQPLEDFLIAEHRGLSEGGMLIARNCQLARTDATDHHRRAVFTSLTADGWVPDGFEVKVTGPSGHRKVWLRLIVETQSPDGRSALHPATLIASVRDL